MLKYKRPATEQTSALQKCLSVARLGTMVKIPHIKSYRENVNVRAGKIQ